MTLLHVDNLSLSFGRGENKRTVVDDISFHVAAGELVALVGESGSGKSLTALSVMGLQPPEATIESGHISLRGESLIGKSDAELGHLRGNEMSMVFQEPMTALNPLHTIGRQLTESFVWHTRPTRAETEQRRTELLDLVGLKHLKDRLDAYPYHLSGGERQRVMIGMAMANIPKLLICDEPTTALDVTLQRQILRLLKDLQARYHMGILLITHDLPVVRKVADRVMVMQHGKILESGPTAQIFDNPQHPYTHTLINALPRATHVPVAADAPEILRCDDLKVHFPVRTGLFKRTTDYIRAVDGVSLTLKQGETLGIVGESGSGKSTLGYGLLRIGPSTGPIVFMGSRIDDKTRSELLPLRRHMQIVFQDPFSSLNPRMNIGDIIAEGLRLHTQDLSSSFNAATAASRSEGVSGGGPVCVAHERKQTAPTYKKHIREAVADMLAEVGLEPEMSWRYPHEFSGGQRQRIAIARAMILKPELVVLDEPTSALDMSVQSTTLDLLQRFQRERGVSYLLISHDLRVIRALSHRVMVMRRGRVIEEGTTESLYENPGSDYTRELMHAAFGEEL